MKNILALLMVLCSISIYAQPPNDACFQAPDIVTVNGYGTFSGSTFGATASNLNTGSITNCLDSLSKDVWFKFNSGLNYIDYEIVIDGGTPNANPSFALYRGICNSSMQIVFEYDCTNYSPINSEKAEMLALGLDPATDYFIRIADYGANTMNFTGTIKPFINPTPNDYCFQATLISMSGSSATFEGNLYGATASNPIVVVSNNCLSNVSSTKDVWYEFTTPLINNLDYKIKIEANSGISSPSFAVYTGVCNAPSQIMTEVDCIYNGTPNSPNVEMTLLGLDSLTTYFIRVMGNSNVVSFTGSITDITPPFTTPLDAGLTHIYKSDTNCQVSTHDSISIFIKNFGTDTISNFPVSYQLEGSSIVTETFTGTILPNAIAYFQFAQPVDLSKTWEIDINAWTNLPNDTINSNDTMQLYLNCIRYDSSGTTPHFGDQYIIVWDDNASDAEIANIQQYAISKGVNILDTIRCADFKADLWSTPQFLNWLNNTIIDMEVEKEKLSNSTAEVNNVDFNTIVDSSAISTKSLSRLKQNSPQYLASINKTTSSNNEIVVAILDTGLDSLPTAYEQTIICDTCYSMPIISTGYNFVANNPNFDDDNDNNGLSVGHGTIVTRIIIDYVNQQGLTNVKIVPLKVLNKDGQGSAWNVTRGILAAKILDAEVIVSSLGWYGEESIVLKDLIEGLGDNCHGIFVASAGNETKDNDVENHYPSNYSFSLDNVIAVGALDNTLNLASYSNYGATTVDVSAPGDVLVRLPSGAQEWRQGTSFAGPFVAGRVISMLNEESSITASQIKTGILSLFDQHPPLYDPAGSIVQSVMQVGDSVYLHNYASDSIVVDPNCTIDDCDTLVDITIGTQRVDLTVMPEKIDINAYPNPFSNEIIFEINLPFAEATDVKLDIFNILGQLVYTTQIPSVIEKQEFLWRSSDISSGIYICRVSTKKGSGFVKIIKRK